MRIKSIKSNKRPLNRCCHRSKDLIELRKNMSVLFQDIYATLLDAWSEIQMQMTEMEEDYWSEKSSLPEPKKILKLTPLVSVICCILRGVPMNSKLLEFFTYYLNLPLKNTFFQFLLTALRKLTANDKNQEIFSIEKWKKTSNIISKLNDDFSENYFELIHISVDPKIKILNVVLLFMTFSAKTHGHF